MRNVIPIIAGTNSIPNEGNLPFTNMESIVGKGIVKAVPDFFDGARPGNVDKGVRKDLSQLIIPTKYVDVPVVPNFYLEAKACGESSIAQRQALQDGAIGARAMHSLQNHGKEEPMYDGNAYTCSSTYHARSGTLQLYAHHVTPPTEPRGRPEYHMTQMDGYVLIGSRKHFVEGVTAFRNARDFAQRHRDKLIHEANARARQLDAAPVNEPETQKHGGPSCEDHVGSGVATKNEATSQDMDDEGSALPQNLLKGVAESTSQEVQAQGSQGSHKGS
jgi:hypothetical protein